MPAAAPARLQRLLLGRQPEQPEHGATACRPSWCRDPFVAWEYFADWPVTGELELEGNARIKTAEPHVRPLHAAAARSPPGHPMYDPDYTKVPGHCLRAEFDRTWPAAGPLRAYWRRST